MTNIFHIVMDSGVQKDFNVQFVVLLVVVALSTEWCFGNVSFTVVLKRTNELIVYVVCSISYVSIIY